MAENTARVGRVSSINYDAGTARVTYADQDGAVTKEVSFVASGTYNMPQVGDLVQITHNSNGTTAACVGGALWTPKSNRPYETGQGLYRQELSNTRNKSFNRYNDKTGEYLRRTNGLYRRQAAEIYDEATGRVGICGGGDVTLRSTGASVGIVATSGVGINAGKMVTIDAGSDVNIEAGAIMSLTTGGKWLREVAGKATDTLKADATATYKAKRTVTVTGPDKQTNKATRQLEVTGTNTEKFKGRHVLQVKGQSTATFEGKRTVTAKADVTEKFKAKVSQKVEGDYKLEIGGTTVEISASGEVTITAAPSIKIDAPTGDITIEGVSFMHHKHQDGGAGEPEK